MRHIERGEGLVEVVVAVAIIAIALGALGAATIAAIHRFGPDPFQSALEGAVMREMRIAVDVVKYQGATITPITVATTIPMPSGSPLPAHLALQATTGGNGSMTIVLSATDDNDASKSATLSQTVLAPAPQPGARLPASSNGAAPQ